MNPAIASYQKNMVQTSSPVENIILLHEKCIQHLIYFRKSLEEKNLVQKAVHLKKAMDIIVALDDELDFSQGEIPAQLHILYQCMLAQLSQSNIKNEIDPVAVTDSLISGLLDVWRKINKDSKADATLSVSTT